MSSFLSSLVAVLAPIDDSLTKAIALDGAQRSWRNPLFGLANVGAHLGDSLLWVAVTGLLWWQAGKQPADETKTRKRTLVGWMGAFVVSVLTTLVFKQIVRRPRPGAGQFLYGPGADQHSFPSGHGARVGVILVWAEALLPGMGWLAPLVGVWIGWARVAMGIHYVGDVLAGVFLGWSVGKVAKNMVERKR